MDVITKKKIGQAINTLLAEQNKRQKDLAKELGVTDNTISYFVSGSRTPNLEQITTIADFFNVSTDFLLGRTKAHTQNTEIRAICDYTGLSEEAVSELHKANERVIIGGHSEILEYAAHLNESALQIANLFIKSYMSKLAENFYTYKFDITEAIKEHRAFIKEHRAFIDNPISQNKDDNKLREHYLICKFRPIESEEGNKKERLAKYELYEATDALKSLFKELAGAEERALNEVKAEYKDLKEAEEFASKGIEKCFEDEEQILDEICAELKKTLLADEKISGEEAKDSENNGNNS